jgi:hypothetical protein
VEWLKRDEIERNVIAVLSGPRGAGKSAQAENWYMYTCVELGLPVLVLTAEGTGTDRHVQGWLDKFAPTVNAKTLPLRVVEQRLDLNSADGRKLVYEELAAMRAEFGENPALCVVDTYSKYSGALKHNDNSEVSAFVGGLDRAIRRPFGCTVLLVAHTGLSDTTRARGASSLEADTDAAYVLTKDRGIVSLTRERFKDSPELPPLKYRLEVVDLGRVDDDDEKVTTRVLVPTTDAHAYQPKAKAIVTVNQKLAFAAVNELSAQGGPVDISRVIDLALSRKAKDSKGRPSDLRRYIREALDAIADAGHVWIDGEQCGPGALQPSEWLA